MGLFDSVAGAVLGKVMGDKGGVAQAAMDMLNQNGGLGGVLDKFRQGGLGNLVDSWVGKGENLPISAEQISSVLGSGAIADMAAKVGLEPETLSAQIAEYLPMVIDKLTPDGVVNEQAGGNVLSTIMGMLNK